MNKLINFFKYNNAVPLIIFALFGTVTATFAASPEARQTVYQSKEQVTRVDNTYIASVDINSHDFKLQVRDVKEDVDNFYITYTYNDISIIDYVWQKTNAGGSITISKKELEGGDLGLFVAKQLTQVVNMKREYLTAVQRIERTAGVTAKVVTTTYSGMIGKFLDPEEKTFDGYVTVIEPKIIPEKIEPEAVSVPEDSGTVEIDTRTPAISLPSTSVTPAPALTSAQIEQLVAEQVRAILAGLNAENDTDTTDETNETNNANTTNNTNNTNTTDTTSTTTDNSTSTTDTNTTTDTTTSNVDTTTTTDSTDTTTTTTDTPTP